MFVTFDLMLERHVCLTRSTDFVIHKQFLTIHYEYGRGVIGIRVDCVILTCVRALRSLVHVKVEPRSTSRLIATLFILPLFYLRD